MPTEQKINNIDVSTFRHVSVVFLDAYSLGKVTLEILMPNPRGDVQFLTPS